MYQDNYNQSDFYKQCTTGEIVRKQSWFMNILVAIDQLGNAVAGGNPDSTISARIGRFKRHTLGSLKRYWNTLEKIVDFTFRPIDGDDHCLQAYLNDKDEEFNSGNILAKIILFIITLGSCIILFPFILIISLLFPRTKTKYIMNDKELTSQEIKTMKRS